MRLEFEDGPYAGSMQFELTTKDTNYTKWIPWS